MHCRDPESLQKITTPIQSFISQYPPDPLNACGILAPAALAGPGPDLKLLEFHILTALSEPFSSADFPGLHP